MGCLLAYIGPETVMPAASILAILVGLVLAFWHYLKGLAVRSFRLLFARGPGIPAPSAPTPASEPANAAANSSEPVSPTSSVS